MTGEVLPRAFYNRPTIEVAKDLLGKILRHGETAGIIVEPKPTWVATISLPTPRVDSHREHASSSDHRDMPTYI
jgi:hypothetical protein